MCIEFLSNQPKFLIPEKPNENRGILLRHRKLLVVYYSARGRTERMAQEICRGAEKLGVVAEVKKAEECSLQDLDEALGIVIGSPTYFSNVAWQIKRLIDESITLYGKGRLRDKVAGCFTSAGTHRDGKDCIKMLELAFGFHHKTKMIPGIICVSSDDDEKVSTVCQQYGAEIAKQLV